MPRRRAQTATLKIAGLGVARPTSSSEMAEDYVKRVNDGRERLRIDYLVGGSVVHPLVFDGVHGGRSTRHTR